MAADVPGIAAARSDRGRVRDICLVISGRGHLAACCHMQQVRRQVVAPRARLAEWGQGAQDQTGVLLAQRRVTAADRRQMVGPKGLKNDIGRRGQAPKQVAPVRLVDVERYAALRRIVIPERQAAFRVRNIVQERPGAPARLAARRLDLNDVGAEIAKQLAAELAGLVGQLQQAETRQRAGQRQAVAHRIISSWYGKRGRLVGQKVPSANPACSSLCDSPSNPSTISCVCSPIIGLGRLITAGVPESLNGAFCTLYRPSAGCWTSTYISRWRSCGSCSIRSWALCTGSARTWAAWHCSVTAYLPNVLVQVSISSSSSP